MKYFILILISAVLLSCSTTGSEPNLEEISVDLNGNIITFLNGSEWSSGPNNSARINYEQNRIMIEGFLEEDGVVTSHISLVIDGVDVKAYGKSEFIGNYFEVASKRGFQSSSEVCSSVADADCEVRITNIDLANNSISGTFNFLARNIENDAGGVLNFTSGEFNNVNLSISE